MCPEDTDAQIFLPFFTELPDEWPNVLTRQHILGTSFVKKLKVPNDTGGINRIYCYLLMDRWTRENLNIPFKMAA